MMLPFEEFLKTVKTLEARVEHELKTDGIITPAPNEYKKYGIKWIWENRLLSRKVTVQCVVSDIEDKIKGAWLEVQHKRELMPRPMDSWARRVYGEVLVYVSPTRGQAVIFASQKLRTMVKANLQDFPIEELQLQNGKVWGIFVPWERFCSWGSVVGVQ